MSDPTVFAVYEQDAAGRLVEVLCENTAMGLSGMLDGRTERDWSFGPNTLVMIQGATEAVSGTLTMRAAY